METNERERSSLSNVAKEGARCSVTQYRAGVNDVWWLIQEREPFNTEFDLTESV